LVGLVSIGRLVLPYIYSPDAGLRVGPDSSGEPGRGEALEEAVVVREPIGSGRPQARVGLPRLRRLD